MYIETTVVSYLTARPSRDLVLRAHQQLTRTWWTTRGGDFELFISPLVLQEAGGGDSIRARRRVQALRGLPVLAATQESIELARLLVREGPIPRKAEVDALHVAIAAVHGIEYLLTWNCTHIANALMRSGIETICRRAGYNPPVLCTPEELMEE